MTLYNWLCLFSVPAIIASVFLYVWVQIRAVKKGVQALLRAQMIEMYNKWYERGYAPIYIRDNFENCWSQYHALGANGVMDDIHEKFLKLPTERGE